MLNRVDLPCKEEALDDFRQATGLNASPAVFDHLVSQTVTRLRRYVESLGMSLPDDQEGAIEVVASAMTGTLEDRRLQSAITTLFGKRDDLSAEEFAVEAYDAAREAGRTAKELGRINGTDPLDSAPSYLERPSLS